MYRPNEKHRKKQLFGFLNQLPRKIKDKLNNSPYYHFYEEVFCQLNEDRFAVLYSDKPSRPNIPINILVGLEILKYLYNLSDEQLFENYYLDIRYKIALGIQQMDEHFYTLRSLYNFRRRVVQYEQETGINLVEEVFNELAIGFIEKAGIQTDIIRMDSTQITSKMKALSRIDIMSRTLVKFLKSLKPDEQEKHAEAYGVYLDDRLYDEHIAAIKQADESLKRLAEEILTILKRYANTQYAQTRDYKVLERVLNDQTIIVEEQIQVKDNKAIAPDSVQTPVDEDATYRVKRGKSYHGYSANFSETANPDNTTQMITGINVDANVRSDSSFFKEDFQTLQKTTQIQTIIVDGGYANDETRRQAEQAQTEMIETAIKGRKPEKTTVDFDIDNTQGIRHCPAGKKPDETGIKNGNVWAFFPHETCQNCPLRNRCVVKEQKKRMKVHISLKRYARDQQREYSKTKEFENLKRLRSGIEGLNSALKRTGLNTIQVVGKARVKMVVGYSSIASNFKRLIKVLGKRGTIGNSHIKQQGIALAQYGKQGII